MTAPIGNYHKIVPAGVNIQIYNVGPCIQEPEACPDCASYISAVPHYPANYYTTDYSAQTTQTIPVSERNLNQNAAENQSQNIHKLNENRNRINEQKQRVQQQKQQLQQQKLDNQHVEQAQQVVNQNNTTNNTSKS